VLRCDRDEESGYVDMYYNFKKVCTLDDLCTDIDGTFNLFYMMRSNFDEKEPEK